MFSMYIRKEKKKIRPKTLNNIQNSPEPLPRLILKKQIRGAFPPPVTVHVQKEIFMDFKRPISG